MNSSIYELNLNVWDQNIYIHLIGVNIGAFFDPKKGHKDQNPKKIEKFRDNQDGALGKCVYLLAGPHQNYDYSTKQPLRII